MSDFALSKWRISKQAAGLESLSQTLREAHANAPLLERMVHKTRTTLLNLGGYGQPGQIEKLRVSLRTARRRLDAWSKDPSNDCYLRQALRWIGSARGWAEKLKDQGSPLVSKVVEEHCLESNDIYEYQEAVCFTLQVEHDADCACDIANEQMHAITDE